MSSIAFAVPRWAGSRDQREWTRQLDAFRTAVSREYYHSNALIEAPGEGGEIRIDRADAGSLSILRYVSSARTQVDRSWQQIREDQSRFFVLWFVIKGRIWITQSNRTAQVEAGAFALSSSGIPFRISSMPDDSGCHQSYQVLIPRHVMAGFSRELHGSCARPFFMSPAADIALGLFEKLLDTVEHLSPALAQRLAEDALDAAISAIPDNTAGGSLDQAERDRLNTIRQFIERNIDVPGLTAAMVAKGCGISASYLFKLLAADNANFRQYLWAVRLDRAHSLLADPEGLRHSVSEVAQMVGFKSNAHFSRAFRKHFGVRPSDCMKLADRHA